MSERRLKKPLARPASPAREKPLLAPGRRERNKQEKLQRIVEAAKKLFGSKGFAETTTQEIAEKADIGTGTLFLYAKSKEDLLIMVFRDEMIETSLGAYKKVPANSSLVDQLMHVFTVMVDYHDRDVELAKALLKEITILTTPTRRSDIRMLMRVIYGGIADLVTAGQAAGKLRGNVDPALSAESLFAIYYLGLLGWLGGQTSKQQMLKRLRSKLAVAVEGLVERTTETPAVSRKKPSKPLLRKI